MRVVALTPELQISRRVQRLMNNKSPKNKRK